MADMKKPIAVLDHQPRSGSKNWLLDEIANAITMMEQGKVDGARAKLRMVMIEGGRQPPLAILIGHRDA